jgi:hypothetical protein
MKKIAFAVVLLCQLACRKDQAKPANESTPEFSETNLQGVDYIDYTPDYRINSISGYGDPKPPSGLYAALPVDTSCSMVIPLPGLPAVTFTVRAVNFYRYTNPGSGASRNYKQRLTLHFSKNDLSLSSFHQCISLYQSGQTPDTDPNRRWSDTLALHDNLYQGCGFSSKDGYIPLKRTIPGKRISYGWIRVEADGDNGVIIKEAAFSRVHNVPVAFGTKN